MASAGWQKRNRWARAQGYRNYYDYRAHDYGKRKPAQPKLSGEALARARGHRGRAELERLVRSGNAELVSFFPLGERDDEGRYRRFEVLAIDSDGRERRYVLRGPSTRRPALEGLRSGMISAGVLYTDSPSLDVWADRDEADLDLEGDDWLDVEDDAA